jgi:hypothetical protein
MSAFKLLQVPTARRYNFLSVSRNLSIQQRILTRIVAAYCEPKICRLSTMITVETS